MNKTSARRSTFALELIKLSGMTRIISVYGIIAGLIASSVMLLHMTSLASHPDMEHGMVIGFASMIIAFSLMFFGIRNYRDKQLNGVISFGKAFKIGAIIALIGSTMYVITWMIYMYNFWPNFMDVYTQSELNKLQKSGASAADIAKATKEMAGYKEMYKNPVYVFLFTYVEILPVGLIVALISALILKRKTPRPVTAGI